MTNKELESLYTRKEILLEKREELDDEIKNVNIQIAKLENKKDKKEDNSSNSGFFDSIGDILEGIGDIID